MLGPASDGGYYLIGLRQPPSSTPDTPMETLFQGIDWSTPRVFQQTLKKVYVDRPEDLAIWERIQTRSSQTHLPQTCCNRLVNHNHSLLLSHISLLLIVIMSLFPVSTLLDITPFIYLSILSQYMGFTRC